MCSEAEARRILQGDRADTLVSIVERAWAAHVDENRTRRKRTRSNVVWDYMVAFGERDLLSMPGVHMVEVHEIPMFIFDRKLILRFKKHSREMLTANVRTRHQRQIDAQIPLPNVPDAVHLSCGYTLDAAEAGINKIVVVKRVDGRREWWIDMSELAAGVLVPTTPILAADPAAADLPTITKRRQEAEDTE